MMCKNMLIALALLGMCVSGCGSDESGPETVSVSGTVSLGGAPLQGADVAFVATDGSFSSFGKTDADGRYRLVQGAVVGENKVTISKFEGGAEPSEDAIAEGLDAGQDEAAAIGNEGLESSAAAQPQQIVPEEYSDPQKTKLTFPVPSGGTESANFDL